MFEQLGELDAPGWVKCSRAGCTNDAVWAVQWRNPRIHAEHRFKVWTACDEHVEFLRGYLEARGFPLKVVAIHREASAELGSAE